MANNTSEVLIKPKRGRRSKKEIAAAAAAAAAASMLKNAAVNPSEPKVVETSNVKLNIEEPLCNDSDNTEINLTMAEENDISKPANKKRGRKPKGGKIIQQILPVEPVKESKPNIILHLKCSIKDLSQSGDHNSNFLSSNIESFSFNNSTIDAGCEIFSNSSSNSSYIDNIPNNFQNTIQPSIHNYNKNDVFNESDFNAKSSKPDDDNDVCFETKELWRKLKVLEKNLHLNNISDKKSACFWCSHDFDNPPIYIPKHFVKDTYHVYGCFCSPECATAYLMGENIDSSTKFERYYLINHIYSKIYEYKKNIKPAPNPHYMLEKFYGNLTIQEYRALLKSERLFLIVDKPLTRILPEFHEDNDEFIINNKIIPSNNFQVKKKLNKKPQTKNNILSEKFGLNSM
jgi:hypothetical protein